MRIKLTPKVVREAQHVQIQGKKLDRTLYWDTELRGFALQVTKAGHRSYVVQYRARGRSRRMAIDGVLSLDKARKRARVLLGEAAQDRDPLAERRTAEGRGRDTFESVAENYFLREGKRLRRVEVRKSAFKRLVYPALRGPIEDIRKSDITRLFDKIEDRSGPVMADRTLAYMRKVLNWHAKRSDTFKSPIVFGMARTSAKDRARSRILSDDEMRAVWSATAEPAPFNALVRFLLLTGARRNEAAEMTWDEIISDGVWLLPAARNKTKVDFARPLSKAARGLIDGIPRLGPYIFSHDGHTPVRGSRTKARLDVDSGVTRWVLHDLRRTARSLMSRVGVPPDVAEISLGHVLPGVRGTYDRHSYLEEKRQAFEALAQEIARIVAPRD